jgi:hypothetical protein
MNWKFFVRMAIPFLRSAGDSFREQDANDTGRDDMIGISLDYAADLIEAVINHQPLPKAPGQLQ